jgi:acyl-CoA thioester hydrolase
VPQTEAFRVHWVDTDASGRIHYTAAFRWAEATEAALFRRIGALEDYGRYPRRHVEAEFRRMLVFNDEIEVRLQVSRIGRTSVSFSWEIWRGDESAIDGRHTVVFVTPDGRPEELHDGVRAALAAES